jgi:hypothetical protein
VRSAYSSGKPAYGVGPGNVPVYVDRSADVARAAKWVTASQNFDNATLCCSEQALVLDRPIAEKMLSELTRRGAHLCDEEETRKLEKHCVRNGMMVADIVGQDPWKVAQAAGFDVPRSTTLLLAHQGGVGRGFPLSAEVLCPLLSVHVVDGWEAGCEVSISILRYGGLGHTIGLWAKDETVLDAWFLEKPANRIVVNGPTSMGAVGYSTGLMPALSLGCGPQAGNITSDNLSARHMINVKRVGFVNDDWDERYERDMHRASGLTGVHEVRGSGLDGDPGLTGKAPKRPKIEPRPASDRVDEVPRSNWRGNPPSLPVASDAPRRAPRFVSGEPAGSGRPSRPARVAAAVTAPTPAPTPTRSSGAKAARVASSSGPEIGLALNPEEIKGILAHAGAGCPLGPCQGCPHNDIRTGACTA